MRSMKKGTIGLVLMMSFSLTTALAIVHFALAIPTCNSPGQNFPAMGASYILQTLNDDATAVLPNVKVKDGYQTKYFHTNCNSFANVPRGATIFSTPSAKATTAHSDATRVELRENRNWFLGNSFIYKQTGTLYILQNSASKSLIFAQIHGVKLGGSEMVMLRWEDGVIHALTRFHYADKILNTVLVSGLRLGEKIDYSIQAVGSSTGMELTITVNTASKTYFMPLSGWRGIGMYFKAGNYNQNRHDDGSQSVLAYSAFNFEETMAPPRTELENSSKEQQNAH